MDGYDTVCHCFSPSCTYVQDNGRSKLTPVITTGAYYSYEVPRQSRRKGNLMPPSHVLCPDHTSSTHALDAAEKSVFYKE